MPLQKLTSFTTKVADLDTQPILDPASLKARFDAAPDEVRRYLNQLIDDLLSATAGNSGAKNIGASTIAGLSGNDVQTLLESLKTTIDNVVVGQLPQGTFIDLYSTLARSFETGVYKKVIFDGKYADVLSEEGGATTVLKSSGKFLITCNLVWNIEPTSTVVIKLYKNGGFYRDIGGAYRSVRHSNSFVADLQQGDQLEFYILQDGANMNLVSSTFQITQLSRR